MLNCSTARLRRSFAQLVALVALCGVSAGSGADTVGSEYAVKAAIVYKIAKFISWPESAFASSTEPLSICLPADDPSEPAMKGLSGDAVHGRSIEILSIEAENIEATDCEVLYVSSASKLNPEDLIATISNQPILTIGDSANFNKIGGIVSLQVRKNRIQFAINADASATAGLGISAQLRQIAGMNDSRKAKR